jgi:hypothetical protein
MNLEGEDGGRKPQFRTYILPWKNRLSLLHADVIKEDGLRMRGVGGKDTAGVDDTGFPICLVDQRCQRICRASRGTDALGWWGMMRAV